MSWRRGRVRRETLTPPKVGTTRTDNPEACSSSTDEGADEGEEGETREEHFFFAREKCEAARKKAREEGRRPQRHKQPRGAEKPNAAASPEPLSLCYLCIVLAAQDWPHFNGSKSH